MEMPFLWEISIPFTFIILPIVIREKSCFFACVLLILSVIACVNEIFESLYVIRYRRKFGETIRFLSRKWINLLSLPTPLSIAYTSFCVTIGLRYSLYQTDVNLLLSYSDVCSIIFFIVLIYGNFYMVTMDEGEEMFILLYNIVISIICSIPITYLWISMIHNHMLFSNISTVLWYVFICMMLLLFLLLGSLGKKEKIKRTGENLFYIRKMFLLPIYYIMQVYDPFIQSFTEDNPAINWNQDLDCRKKSRIIAKELENLRKQIKKLPERSICVAETHETISDHIPNPLLKISDPLMNKKISKSFEILYGNNWNKTDMCNKCQLYPDKTKCSVSCQKRKAYIIFFIK